MGKDKQTGPPQIEAPSEGTVEAKTAFRLAFEKLGGVDKLVAWAKNNRTAFYTHYARLIPMMVAGEIKHSVEDADAARQKLMTMFDRLAAQGNAEHAAGIFRNQSGDIITDPELIRLSQQIYDLKRRRADIVAGIIDVTPAPEPANPPRVLEQQQSVKLKVVSGTDVEPKPSAPPPEKPAREPSTHAAEVLTPAQARKNPMQPSYPQPQLTGERTVTQKYLDRCGNGPNYWGPI
jgi:hypothetical protein